MTTAEKYQRYVNPSALALLRLGGFDATEYSGCGAVLTDTDGKEYIDCLGGYGVFALGHAHPEVVEAVHAQMRRLPLSSKTFLNAPLADLAERLAAVSPGDLQYSFLCNSGTEAVEAALKFARMAKKGRTKIVSTVGSYHGKTFGALSASGREVYKTPFAPLLPGFVTVPFGDVAALEAAVDGDTAAVILEPIQGEGGIHVSPDDYLPAARAACDRHGALLILDEVQTGLGRTGTLFACERWGVAPDLMTLAKALGGGVMPVGAVLGTPAVWEAVFKANPYIHSSTFGGGEAACVAALTALDIIQRDGLAGQAKERGTQLKAGLQAVADAYPDLLSSPSGPAVRGLGLMLGVEFADADVAKLAIGALVRRGVIAAYTLNSPTVLRFEPPLIISAEQVDRVIDVFGAAVGEVGEMLTELAA